MRTLTRSALAGALASAIACGGSMTSPTTPAGPLSLTVMQLPTFSPGSLFFGLELKNISQAPVDLTFPSSCQVLPYFVERATGRAVTPVGGGFACATVITRSTLTVGVSVVHPVMVKAGTVPEPQMIVLPPGDYALYARLEDSTYRIQSEPFPFTVR